MSLTQELLNRGFLAHVWDIGADYGWAMIQMPVTYAAFGFAVSDHHANALRSGEHFAMLDFPG